MSKETTFESMKAAAERHAQETQAKFDNDMQAANAEQAKANELLTAKLQRLATLENENRRKALEAEQEKAAKDAAEAVRSKSPDAWSTSPSADAMRSMLKSMQA